MSEAATIMVQTQADACLLHSRQSALTFDYFIQNRFFKPDSLFYQTSRQASADTCFALAPLCNPKQRAANPQHTTASYLIRKRCILEIGFQFQGCSSQSSTILTFRLRVPATPTQNAGAIARKQNRHPFRKAPFMVNMPRPAHVVCANGNGVPCQSPHPSGGSETFKESKTAKFPA